MACGPWLVVRSGDARSALQVRSLLTGALQQEREYAEAPALTCASSGELLVADTELSLMRLPTLEEVWRMPLGEHQPVRALAVLEHFVALVGVSSTDVALLPHSAR